MAGVLYVRGERRMAAWLVSQGMPASGATVLLWGIRLGVLAAFFYFAAWIAVVVLVAVTAARAMGQNALQDDGFELQYPIAEEELQNSPGYDPNMHNNISHEMYRHN